VASCRGLNYPVSNLKYLHVLLLPPQDLCVDRAAIRLARVPRPHHRSALLLQPADPAEDLGPTCGAAGVSQCGHCHAPHVHGAAPQLPARQQTAQWWWGAHWTGQQQQQHPVPGAGRPRLCCSARASGSQCQAGHSRTTCSCSLVKLRWTVTAVGCSDWQRLLHWVACCAVYGGVTQPQVFRHWRLYCDCFNGSGLVLTLTHHPA
jgi:hypothetical protein